MSEDVLAPLEVDAKKVEEVVVQEANKVEDQAEFDAGQVLGEADDFIGTHVAVPVQNEFEKLKAEEEKIVAEAQKIEHIVVNKIETVVKEAEVAAENVVRKVVNHNLNAGGGSVIKNPA